MRPLRGRGDSSTRDGASAVFGACSGAGARRRGDMQTKQRKPPGDSANGGPLRIGAGPPYPPRIASSSAQRAYSAWTFCWLAPSRS